MSVNLQKIKKWTNMLLGKSSYHVNQDVGKCYSKTEIKGYYNDLTEKITRFGLEGNDVPKTVVDSGEELFFSIAIFQYGLAAYDLYLLNHEDKSNMKKKVIACAEWTIKNQNEDGSWETFAYESPDYPFSSMAQGEAISLLIRAYFLDEKQEYLSCAKKAFEFMIKPIKDGGTTIYMDNDVYFYECPADPLILNGWIFSLWGVFDYVKYFDDNDAKNILEKTLISLKKKLPEFDMNYWSMYEDGRRIASPFYHKLHIAQLWAMYELFEDEIYKEYAERWEKYQHNFWNSKRAFLKKAMQKITE